MIGLKEHSAGNPHPKGTGIVGISMGNSKFTEKYIRALFEDMRNSYASLAVMLPDIPAQFTLQALFMHFSNMLKPSRKCKVVLILFNKILANETSI